MNSGTVRMGKRVAEAMLLTTLIVLSAAMLCSDRSDAASETFSEGGLKYTTFTSEVRVSASEDLFAEDLEIPSKVTHNGTEYTVTSVGKDAFKGCTVLKTVSLPDTVIYIGDYAFSGCESLETIDLGNTVKTIGSNAFQGCKELTLITLPDAVTSLGNYAFKGCEKLTSAEFGSGLGYISYGCFSGCTSLGSFTVPETVSEIKGRAFYGCTSLVQLNILNPEFSDKMVKSDSFALGGDAKTHVECTINCAAYPSIYKGLNDSTLKSEYNTEITYNSDKYSLTLRWHGSEKTVDVVAGTLISELIPSEALEREGYTFNGWSPELPKRMPAEDVEYTAQWAPNQNIVTFDPNPDKGGIGTEITRTFASNQSNYLVSFKDTGFDSKTGIFKGWSDDPDGAVKYADGSLFSTLHNVTLYAVWEILPYKVIFDKNNADSTGEMLDQPFASEKKELRKIGFALTGYTFEGWSLSKESGGTVLDPDSEYYFTDLSSDSDTVTLYAIWSPVVYTVVLDFNDGSGNTKTYTLTYDDHGTDFPQQVRTGYTLAGWKSQGSTELHLPGTEMINLAAIDGISVKLYAEWEANEYQIVFHSNISGSPDKTTSQSYYYGSKVELSANTFINKFYKFCGWAADPNGKTADYEDCDKLIITKENVDLYAVWEIGQYHIIYDPGDGDGALMDFPWVTYFEEYTIPDCTYLYSNHNFKGWLCELDDKIYQPGDVVENLSDGYSQIILYAQWESDDSGSLVLIIGSVLGLVILGGAAFVFLRRRH